MRILVVEDELSVAELLQRSLERMGNTCHVAPSAQEAARLLDEQVPDAVTLDLGMPDGDGLDWLESVAASRPELARKTLVITGRTLDPDAVARLTRCGAGMLAKPFTLDQLAEAVRVQIEWRPPSGGARRD